MAKSQTAPSSGTTTQTVVFAVANDVFADQRVNKMARTVSKMGFRVVIAGLKRKGAPHFIPAYAEISRIRTCSPKGFLYFASFNISLFFYLLIKRYDILVANDLDTLLAAQLATSIRKKILIYDTHEYFTGMPEIFTRPHIYKVWKGIENWLFPKQHTIITVNKGIARLYKEEYGKEIFIVRNLPPYRPAKASKTMEELKIPGLYDEKKHKHKRFIILQGAGINTDRGAEELVEAMLPIYGLEDLILLIIGGGNVIDSIKKKVSDLNLVDRVVFLPKMIYEDLFNYTVHASIGVSIDKDHGLNYRYSLPNKLFDYIMAGTPVLTSDLPEVSRIVDTYQVGKKIQNHDPSHIAKCLNEMLTNNEQMKIWRENCLKAARELCWESEEDTVRQIYEPYISRK